MIKIIYKKRNGEIFERIRSTYCPYRVGDVTSMGWKVVNILYKYKNKYYTKIDYDELINKDIYISKTKTKLLNIMRKIIRNTNKIIIFLILFKHLESLVISTI